MTDDTTPPPKVNAHRGSGAGDGDENTRVSDATQIVQMAQLVGAELFHTVAGAPYVTVPVGDHRETYGLRARTCLAWLSQIVYATTSRCPSSTALAAATNTLAGIAVFDGPVRRVDVRIAEDEGALWLDLGDPAWRVVRITPEGWGRACRRVGPVPPPARDVGATRTDTRWIAARPASVRQRRG